MSKISLKHSGGKVVSLNSPTTEPNANDVAFKLPNADGSNGQALVTDGAGNLSFANAGSGRARNLIINGAMQVAQRGTSSTSTGYQTVDRITISSSGTDESPTYSQVDVASGTTPYTLGFRKAFKIQNGNQTSGAGAADYIEAIYKIEAQDIANSGWNYTSNSSFVTLSFWCKSSVAQNFFFFLKTSDGTNKQYPFQTGSLSADTWTKITKTISGNSGLQFDNDNGEGLRIDFSVFYGTNKTNNSATVDQWANYNGSARTPDQTSTWYTTNDATLEITGVQLEVGSVATDFEHRSFGQELALCQRYFQKYTGLRVKHYTDNNFDNGSFFVMPVAMRSSPTITNNQTTNTNATVTTSSINNQSFFINLGRSSAGVQEANFSPTFNSEL